MSAIPHTLRVALGALVTVSLGVMTVGCDDDDKLVTVRGIVLNIDTGGASEGVSVSLLDAEYRDRVVTGSDGAYSIRVPKGSTLVLHTDDAPGSAVDEWIPLINVEVPQPIADGDIDGLITHACPSSSGENQGSIAIWDDYLVTHDADNGDLFAAESSAASSGVIAGLFWECTTTGGAPDEGFLSGITADTGLAEFPIAYPILERTLGIENMLQSEPILEAGETETGSAGYILSFGDPAFAGDSVMLAISDNDGSRNYAFRSPVEVPVRPGTISLVWGLVVDGVVNSSVNDLLACFTSGP